MVTKADFSADEWNMLLAAPTLAGMAITLAEPSGILGMLQEGWASARSLLNEKSNPSASVLAKAIVDDLSTSQGRTAAQQFIRSRLTAKSAAEAKQQIVQALADVGTLIDRKGADNGAELKKWLCDTAQNVAQASTEGGFLGFGGVTISEAEKATIDEISKALRI